MSASHSDRFIGKVPPHVWPLVAVVMALGFFVIVEIRQISSLTLRSGFWLVIVILRTVLAPFVQVEFAETFIADQLMSLAFVFYDMEFTLCFFSYQAWIPRDRTCSLAVVTSCTDANKYSRPILAVFPPLFRTVQSLQRARQQHNKWQIGNAGRFPFDVHREVLCSHYYFSDVGYSWSVSWKSHTCTVDHMCNCQHSLQLFVGCFAGLVACDCSL